ncbi:MAG TPA: hypothetical protein VEH49_05430 [Methylomirabilota bacterium]|nr:hypothetical protein [Methylomirabilota bacterium]
MSSDRQMGRGISRRGFAVICVLFAAGLAGVPAFPAMKNMALVVAPLSRLDNVALADLAKFCRGGTKTWPDGRAFQLVTHDLDAPEMRVAVEKLFGMSPVDAKLAVVKLNSSRQGNPVVRIVETDEELLRHVAATPGAVGLVDVYSINSGIKVLRVDGKLPFDAGYPFKGN